MLRDIIGTDPWLVTESGFDLDQANTRETQFCVGNGYLGTRGGLEEGHEGGLPGTFISGVYDSNDAPVIDLVNAPDWTSLSVYVDGVRLDVESCTVLEHERVLDLRQGLLWRATTFEDPEGRRTRLESVRLASMADRHVCATRTIVTALNHSGLIEISSGIEGRKRNLERLPVYAEGTTFSFEDRWDKWARSRHLRTESVGVCDDGVIYLNTRTIARGTLLSYAAGVTTDDADEVRTVLRSRDQIGSRSLHRLTEGSGITVDKIVAICTSRDYAADEPASERCLDKVREATALGFDALVAANAAAWQALWDACDSEVVDDERLTLAVRFDLYHLLITANPDDPTVNIGAKSLSGEGYRGHVFWDTEIMMLPFYNLTHPEAAKALLRYRHHTLGGARENSASYGTTGARYAWESADTGQEECPVFTPDGANRFFTREEEVHVSADVAYGVVKYVEASGDTDFLHREGAEILFDTSRFWASRAERAPGGGWQFTTVMGPDEFHSHVDNNAFTNVLVQWHLRCAADLYDELAAKHPELLAEVSGRLGLSADEPAEWRAVADALVSTHPNPDGLIEQFDGYFERTDVEVSEWDENGMPRYPKGYHHFNCETTQLLKQPDVVMLFFMLPDLHSAEVKKVNYEYYEARTLHKSSLSPSIHAIVGIEVGDPARAVDYFERSALVDISDNQGNTAEGMHIASAGGTWQILASGFGGMRVMNGGLTFNPWLPEGWQGVRYRIQWRGLPLHVDVSHDAITFDLHGPADATLPVLVGTEQVVLSQGQTRVTLPS